MTDERHIMSQADFAFGWRLLIIQPWGWRYNQTDSTGRPTVEAKTQLEFYYDKLKWAQPKAWWKVAEMYAQGKEWPNLSDLQRSLSTANSQCLPAVTDARPGVPMPEEVRAALERCADLKTMTPPRKEQP